MKNLQSFEEYSLNEKYSGVFLEYLRSVVNSLNYFEFDDKIKKFNPGTIEDAYNEVIQFVPKKHQDIFTKLVNSYLKVNKMGVLQESVLNESFQPTFFEQKDAFKYMGDNPVLDDDLFIGLAVTQAGSEKYLYTLDKIDRDLTKDVKNEPGKVLVRYESPASRSKKMSNIAKLDMKRGLLWYTTQYKKELIKFYPTPTKLKELNLLKGF